MEAWSVYLWSWWVDRYHHQSRWDTIDINIMNSSPNFKCQAVDDDLGHKLLLEWLVSTGQKRWYLISETSPDGLIRIRSTTTTAATYIPKCHGVESHTWLYVISPLLVAVVNSTQACLEVLACMRSQILCHSNPPLDLSTTAKESTKQWVIVLPRMARTKQ